MYKRQITSYVDIVPTLLSYTEVKKPARVKFDGVNIRPLIEDKAKSWDDRILVTDSQRVKDPIKWKTSAVMTEQWRLINGKDLFDINKDPGQKANIAKQNPKVVKRLRDFYDAWWAELEPTFSQTTEIYLGHPAENPARLTSHDWITTRLSPWNQAHIRNMENREGYYGFWAVKVVESGDYEVEIRRWPKEANKPISGSLPPGDDVPGEKAFRVAAGKSFPAVKAVVTFDGKEYAKPVKGNAESVTFDIPLKKGSDKFYARFEDSEGNQLGAYYAYVKKK